jgi:YesN/AraC family two-component response regulator
MDKVALIVIDDDFSSRNTIKNILRNSGSYFLVNDFSDAAAAINWLKDNKADIALCDMNMPNIDGIEFITRALCLCPDMHFLAISAYSDFRYLRECVVNPVEDYILKHELTADLLINTLDKIKEKYNIRPSTAFFSNTLNIIEQDVQFTNENIRELIKYKGINFTIDAVVPMVISPDYNSELFSNYTSFSNNIVFAIQDLICNVLDNKYAYLIHMTHSFQFALLISFIERPNNSIIQNKIRSLSILIKDKVLRLFNVTLTIGYYPAATKLENALKHFECLKNIRTGKLYKSVGSSFILDEANSVFSGKYTLPRYIKEQLKTFVELKDFAALKECIHNIFADMSEKHIAHEKVSEICSRLHEIINVVFSNNEYQANGTEACFLDYEFIGQFEKGIIDLIDNFTKNVIIKNSHQYSPLVLRAIAYIDDHYTEQMSLESCASDADISYAYLSRIFKKETGSSFSEYLNRFRVSKAKILLAKKETTIKQIVDETGFTNYNYFFKVFKEIEGITPAEYTESANK